MEITNICLFDYDSDGGAASVYCLFIMFFMQKVVVINQRKGMAETETDGHGIAVIAISKICL